ncbi:MAG: M20 family metallo-hydrolase [Lachnospiraceae bacterium]|jgi:allantoate deiminase|nr:M20 family metallo-hydrolase [Lachnospiraceae bacterium]MCI9589177.1 M20 family metallo-hydrolase [Lachnospiraceae bacterium]
MLTKIERIQKDLETLATFTSTPGKGVTRSSYSKEDTMAKEYLLSEMKKLNLQIYEDGVGTIFGRKEGTLKDAPVVMLGSHYDSVVNGGAFDGAAGTVAALEVMRVLTEEGFVNDYPLELIVMNAEEGATFGPSTGVTNSRAMVGTLTMEELKTVKNRFGQTKFEAMTEYGLSPDLKSCIRKPGSIKNFVEMHVEQGPVLDREGIEIGLIEYLAGIGRYTLRFYGKTADSTAPMNTRKDALVAAASFIQEFDACIKALGNDVTGMVGKLDITPNSNQFVPEYVEGKVEIRTFKKEITQTTDFNKLIQDILDRVSAEYDIRCELQEIRRINYPNPTGPSVMNPENVETMKAICDDLGYSYLVINNGTGHDSMIMTDFCDTNMIYVPSRNGGVSHCPEEWSEYADIKKGADVLLHLIKKLSAK